MFRETLQETMFQKNNATSACELSHDIYKKHVKQIQNPLKASGKILFKSK